MQNDVTVVSLVGWVTTVLRSRLRLRGYLFAELAWLNPSRKLITPGRLNQVRSEERRVGKSVDLGGRRIIKKKK